MKRSESYYVHSKAEDISSSATCGNEKEWHTNNRQSSSYSYDCSMDENCCYLDDEIDDFEREECFQFANVCRAFQHYSVDAMREVFRMERNLHALYEKDKELLCEKIECRIMKIKEAIQINQAFISLLLSPHVDPLTSTQRSFPFSIPENNDSNDKPEAYHKKVNGQQEHDVQMESSQQEDNLQKESSQQEKKMRREISDNYVRNIKEADAEELETHELADPMISEKLEEKHIKKKHISPLDRTKINGHFVHDHSVVCKDMSSKVRSTLRQFVRDWSEEGFEERNSAYGPLLNALTEYMPIKDVKKPPRVLCPGSGLGRLLFEVVLKGYVCQGNEFSYFMLLGSNFALNCYLQPKSCLLMPYCLSTSNRRRHDDHLKRVLIPDLCPSDYLSPDNDFSMCAGDFVEVYATQKEEWDAVLTCFFIDTAKNVLLYIKIIANLLREGGMWSNFGPLLYHFAEMPNEMSIELSWEEIKLVINKFFTMKVEEWKDSYYTTNNDSMMQMQYHCVFMVAIRNNVPVTVDISNLDVAK